MPDDDNLASGNGDPHIVTFRGDQFDFMGEDGKWYNFLSAGSLQLNVKMHHFEGGRTYINDVGVCLEHVKFNHVRVSMADGWLQMNPELDTIVQSQRLTMGWKPKKSVLLSTGQFQIVISRGLEMYSGVECPHINVHLKIGELGALHDGVVPHGVIGQFATRLKGVPKRSKGKQGEGVIDGTYRDYEVSGPFDTNFVFNRYKTEPTVEPQAGFGFRRYAISHL